MAATLGGEIGKLGLNAGYVKADEVVKLGQDDKIWYVGADYKFGDFTVDATYLSSDVDKIGVNNVDDDGYVIGWHIKVLKQLKLVLMASMLNTMIKALALTSITA